MLDVVGNDGLKVEPKTTRAVTLHRFTTDFVKIAHAFPFSARMAAAIWLADVSAIGIS